MFVAIRFFIEKLSYRRNIVFIQLQDNQGTVDIIQDNRRLTVVVIPIMFVAIRFFIVKLSFRRNVVFMLFRDRPGTVAIIIMRIIEMCMPIIRNG